MSLNEQQQQQIKQWLDERCKNLRCTCCGHGKWAIVDMATMPIGFNVSDGQFLFNQGIPQVSIACQHCAHMLFFSAQIIGVNSVEQQASTSMEAAVS